MVIKKYDTFHARYPDTRTEKGNGEENEEEENADNDAEDDFVVVMMAG
jgi:hypothetical protein